jgi:hypothetical protein
MKKIFLLILAALLLISPAFCQEAETSPAIAWGVKELKTIDMYFGYTAYIDRNTPDSKILNFTPIDGVYEVKSTLIRIVEEQGGITTISIWVNDVPCKTPSLTSIVGKSQYVADFDCVNVINSSGIYNVKIVPSTDISNVHYRAWITYVNNPENQTQAMMNDLKLFMLASREDDPITSKYCLDNSTLVIEKTSEWHFNNITYLITKNETIKCEFGCDPERKECNRATWIYIIIIMIIIALCYLLFKLVIIPLITR